VAASDKSDSQSAEAVLLADYFLAASPESLYLINSDPDDIYWPESRLADTQILSVSSLGEAESSLAQQNLGASATSDQLMAVFHISDGETIEQQLGRAVRAFPHRLVVYTEVEQLSDTLFYAFGFRKLNVEGKTEPSRRYRWYEYRLSHYKERPNWLNARFWANPERFELDDDADIYFDSDEEE